MKKQKYKCFFCGKRFNEKGIDSHFHWGPNEFPVCINGKPVKESYYDRETI